MNLKNFTMITAPEPDLTNIYTDKRFETDPLAYYQEGSHVAMLDACGWIPLWIQQWLDRDDSRKSSLLSYLEEQYAPSPLINSSRSKIDMKGTLVYPDDPDQFPYLMVDVLGLRPLYMYPNAWVAIPKGNTHTIVHMD